MDNQPFINNKKLRQIRKNTDWRKVAAELQLELDKDRSNPDDLWANSPFSDEKEASLHINDKGFYCHASKEKGGPIELVQKVLSKQTGERVNCYQAGQWLLDHDLSCLDLPDKKEVKKKTEKPPETLENKPVRQSLIKSLSQLGTHPEFTKRDISEKACKYLGCGFLESGKGILKDRIVFQIRGVRFDKEGELVPVILSHTGMATTEDQIKNGGKWLYYEAFNKDLEIFNIDNILFDPRAAGQARYKGEIIIVEGFFDAAKLIEAGIYNVVATFGPEISDAQLVKLQKIADSIGVQAFQVWYDRDKDGEKGQKTAIKRLKDSGLGASGFDWRKKFSSKARDAVSYPKTIKSVAEFTKSQLKWIRSKKII